jgi:membrane protease YdiL (CAAX protease family)
MTKVAFSKEIKTGIVLMLMLDLFLSFSLSSLALSFFLQAGLVFFTLVMAAQYSRAYLMGDSLDMRSALSRAFWTSLLFLLCWSLNGIMMAFTLAAVEYLKSKGAFERVSRVGLYFLGLNVLYLLPSVLLLFAPQVLAALHSIPYLYSSAFWACHLLYVLLVAKEMGVKPLQKIFQWRLPSKKTVAYTILGIVVFLLTSPALYVVSNYAAVSSMMLNGGYLLHLAMAAIMYSIQPLVEELLARTGMIAFLNYYGIAGENKNASIFRRFVHKFCVGLLMGFLFGFMHSSVVGAASIGLSALFYHTLMGIVFAMVSLWTDGIEIAAVFHSMHNYSVTVFQLFYRSIMGAFKPLFLIPVALGRLLLTWLGISVIDALVKDPVKATSAKALGPNGLQPAAVGGSDQVIEESALSAASAA